MLCTCALHAVGALFVVGWLMHAYLQPEEVVRILAIGCEFQGEFQEQKQRIILDQHFWV